MVTRAGVSRADPAGGARIIRVEMPDWVSPYFEAGYAQRWGLPDLSDRIGLEAEGLWNLLQLTPTARVIDIGCGHGRHALALAQRGADVIGIDFATALLSRAQQLAGERRTGVRWIRADMRRLPIRSACAGAALVVDAFGFFETDDEHDMVFLEAARVLRTGGGMAMKIVNGGLVLDSFRETDREERDRTHVTVSRTLTLDSASNDREDPPHRGFRRSGIRATPAPVPNRGVDVRPRAGRVLRRRRIRATRRRAIPADRLAGDVGPRPAALIGVSTPCHGVRSWIIRSRLPT